MENKFQIQEFRIWNWILECGRMKYFFLLISISYLQVYSQDSSQQKEDPCSEVYGMHLNFIFGTTEIYDTECENLLEISKTIIEEGKIFYIIGIYTDDINKKLAWSRAQSVKTALVLIGVPIDILLLSTSYYESPQEGEAYDWPFYPQGYEYEIGVHFQIEH